MPHNRGVGPLEYYRCKLSMSQGLSSRPGRLKVTWMPTLCLRLWLREQLQCLVVHVHISNKGETPILHPTTRLPKAASDKRWVYGESIWRLRDYSRKCLSFLEKWVFMCFAIGINFLSPVNWQIKKPGFFVIFNMKFFLELLKNKKLGFNLEFFFFRALKKHITNNFSKKKKRERDFNSMKREKSIKNTIF